MTGLLIFSVLLLICPSASFPVQPTHLNHHNPDSDVFCYNLCSLVVGHQRVLQGLDTGLNFSFQAFGRTLDLSLLPEKYVFSSTPTLHYSDGTVQDVSHLYQGTVRGMPGSSVHLSVLDGQAEGSVVLPGEITYDMEPVKCPFSGLPSDTLVHDRTQMVETVTPDGRNSMENRECSAEECLKLHDFVDLSFCEISNSVCRSCSVIRKRPVFHENWIPCRESDDLINVTWFRNNVCNLHLYADPTLWRHFKYERFGASLADEETLDEITKFFAGHVYFLKLTFGDTEFRIYDDREMWRGIDFAVDYLTVMTDKTEKCDTSRPNMLCSPNVTVNNFESIITSINHDEYCLAIFFTYRDFDGDIGGTPKPSPFRPWGGICDRYLGYQSENGTVYSSGNVIWVTLVGKNRPLTDQHSHLLLAQEVGTAFGSPYDDGPDCAPGEDNPAGNYLMYKEVFRFQNNRFSICSKDNITRFLSSVIYSRHGRYNCLKPSVSGEGLLHRFGSPDTSSENEDDPEFSKYDRKLDDEL